MTPTTQPSPVVPPDDLSRSHTLAQPDSDQNLPHIGVAGGTYTITVPGEATAGRFSVIDMHIPPGGGPPPHRHDFLAPAPNIPTEGHSSAFSLHKPGGGEVNE